MPRPSTSALRHALDAARRAYDASAARKALTALRHAQGPAVLPRLGDYEAVAAAYSAGGNGAAVLATGREAALALGNKAVFKESARFWVLAAEAARGDAAQLNSILQSAEKALGTARARPVLCVALRAAATRGDAHAAVELGERANGPGGAGLAFPVGRLGAWAGGGRICRYGWAGGGEELLGIWSNPTKSQAGGTMVEGRERETGPETETALAYDVPSRQISKCAGLLVSG